MLGAEVALQARARTGDLAAASVYYMGREPWEIEEEFFRYLRSGRVPEMKPEDVPPSPDRLAILPPGSGKTTRIQTLTTMQIAWDRNFRWLLGSKAINMARQNARFTRFHLEHNARLIRDFGQFVGLKWTETEYEVSGRDPRINHPTVRAIGTSTSSLGPRCDAFIGDDLIDRANAKTPYLRESFADWLSKMALSRIDGARGRPWPYGSAIYIGNFWHKLDQYNRMIDEKRIAPFIRKVFVDEARTTTFIPQLFTVEDLAVIRHRVTAKPFEQLYMMDLRGGTKATFNWDWRRFWTDDAGKLTKRNALLPNVASMRLKQGWDLAGGDDPDKNDFIAGATLAIKPPKVFVLDVFRQRVPDYEQVRAIRRHARRWNPDRVNIESNFNSFVARHAAEDPWLLTKIRPTRSPSTFSKEERNSMALSNLVERGDLHFPLDNWMDHEVDPTGDEYEPSDAVAEFFDFPFADWDDVVDAIEIALRDPKPVHPFPDSPALATKRRRV